MIRLREFMYDHVAAGTTACTRVRPTSSGTTTRGSRVVSLQHETAPTASSCDPVRSRGASRARVGANQAGTQSRGRLAPHLSAGPRVTGPRNPAGGREARAPLQHPDTRRADTFMRLGRAPPLSRRRETRASRTRTERRHPTCQIV